jgi:hypothetical protein
MKRYSPATISGLLKDLRIRRLTILIQARTRDLLGVRNGFQTKKIYAATATIADPTINAYFISAS